MTSDKTQLSIHAHAIYCITVKHFIFLILPSNKNLTVVKCYDLLEKTVATVSNYSDVYSTCFFYIRPLTYYGVHIMHFIILTRFLTDEKKIFSF